MLSSTKPYLLRALYDWLLDNDQTPYILVDADCPDVVVPNHCINDDATVVLNISPNATANLSLENDFVMFDARFQGRSHELIIPLAAIRAIYSKECGDGMHFADAAIDDSPEVQKSQYTHAFTAKDKPTSKPFEVVPESDEANQADDTTNEKKGNDPTPPKKPTLTLV